jgi:hypothetical protein
MRSLERLALSKGLIKDDPILQKIASLKSKKVIDLIPTTNLTDNLMKLCAGLRASGLAKYAEELESNFVMYKKAESLYETSKEEGEDLVNAAHPKGSHKLEGVDGDSVIETIIDQQLQDLKMIDKKPGGKLSNANEIIGAVRIVLADEEVRDIPEFQNKGTQLLSQAIDTIMSGFNNIKKLPFLYLYRDKVDEIISILSRTKNDINQGKFISGEYLDKLFGTIQAARQVRDLIYEKATNVYPARSEDLRNFLPNIGLIDKGVALSWGANKAFRGDLTASQFHESGISATEVMSSIKNLISGIGSNLARFQMIGYDQKKNKLEERIRNMADEFRTKLNNSIKAAEQSTATLQAQTFGRGLGVINAFEIGNLFGPPLDFLKLNYQSLEQFNNRILTLVNTYKTSMDGLEKVLTSVS